MPDKALACVSLVGDGGMLTFFEAMRKEFKSGKIDTGLNSLRAWDRQLAALL